MITTPPTYSPADSFGVTMEQVFERLGDKPEAMTFQFNRCQCCGGWIGNEPTVHRKIKLGWGWWHLRCVPPLTLSMFRLRCLLGIERRPWEETWPERLSRSLRHIAYRIRRTWRAQQ